MKKKWKNGLVNLEKEISELTDKLYELKVGYRGVNRLIDGKNIHIIKGKKQNRLKIIWGYKFYWFHIPTGVDIKKRSEELTDQFIDDILSGRRR